MILYLQILETLHPLRRGFFQEVSIFETMARLADFWIRHLFLKINSFSFPRNSKKHLTNLSRFVLKSALHENVSATQVEYLKENCIAVDENDRVLGEVSKAECHKKETGSEAFVVLIYG